MTFETSATDSKKSTKLKKANNEPKTKVVIRRLPPSLTNELFLESVEPLSPYNYYYYVKGEDNTVTPLYSRAYICFVDIKDVWIFQEKFDGYVFMDSKGNEYPAIVEYAPYSRIPKNTLKKPDARISTIVDDADYLKFLNQLEHPQSEPITAPDNLVEEIQQKEKDLKAASRGMLKTRTPLVDFLFKRREEKELAHKQAREERKKKEQSRQKLRENRKDDYKNERKEDRVEVGKDEYKDKDKNSKHNEKSNAVETYKMNKGSRDVIETPKSSDISFTDKIIKNISENKNQESYNKEYKKELKDRDSGKESNIESKESNIKKQEEINLDGGEELSGKLKDINIKDCRQPKTNANISDNREDGTEEVIAEKLIKIERDEAKPRSIYDQRHSLTDSKKLVEKTSCSESTKKSSNRKDDEAGTREELQEESLTRSKNDAEAERKNKIKNKDRPERAIYVPTHRRK